MAQSLLFATVAAPSFGTSGALFGMKTVQLLAQSLLFGTLAAPSFGTSGALFGMKAGCCCSYPVVCCPTGRSVIDGAVVELGCSVVFSDGNEPLASMVVILLS